MSPTEEWRPVPGLPAYLVSNLGRVQSLKGRSPRILRLDDRHAEGYLRVTLMANGVGKNRYVHQLVASAFHGERPIGCEVRHLDGDPRNNAADNLRWGTRSENVQDTLRHGTHGNQWTARRARAAA